MSATTTNKNIETAAFFSFYTALQPFPRWLEMNESDLTDDAAEFLECLADQTVVPLDIAQIGFIQDSLSVDGGASIAKEPPWSEPLLPDSALRGVTRTLFLVQTESYELQFPPSSLASGVCHSAAN